MNKLKGDSITEEPNKKDSPWMEILKFVLFEASAGIIQFGSFTLMHEVIFKSWPYWPVYAISVFLSVIWSFTFNRKYTFKSAANVPVAMIEVALFYVAFIPLSTWLGSLAIGESLSQFEVTGVESWKYYLCLAVTMLANFVLEFVYEKFFVFRPSKGQLKPKENKTDEPTNL